MVDQRYVPELSVVIPAYNEQHQLERTLEAVGFHAGRASSRYEIIVVDDGSSDSTWDVLQQCAMRMRGVRGIRLSRNFGKETALCAGLEEARGAAVIVMDADLQHPPELIAMMVHLWRTDAKADIVEGIKRVRGTEPLTKRLGAKAFYGALTRLTGHRFEGASDYKLLDRKVVDAWKRLPERTTFFRGMIVWLGFRTVQVEFDVPPRSGGKTRWSFLSLAKLALNAIIAYSAVPLRLIGVVGLLFLLGAFALGAQTLFRKWTGDAVTGFTTVILLLLVIGSAVMISLSTIGEYVAAIYNEVKGRPRYLIRERVERETEGNELALSGSRHA
ncbi:glycosyltransferase family 2 protein [Paenibacillus sp. GYB003]|jgi:glycosyltransferase involved in cell wall biosynthesis|uniref:glycosyltransferase family 2 protein n=1 Tax=Paenibacillus sp. GYB003 TaxID=2994392 RepID=UPI002F968814